MKWILYFAAGLLMWWLFGGMVKTEVSDFVNPPAETAIKGLGRQLVGDVVDDVKDSLKPARTDENRFGQYRLGVTRIRAAQQVAEGADEALNQAPTPTTPVSKCGITALQAFSVSQTGEAEWIIELDPRQEWAGTGILLKTGDEVQFSANGQICSSEADPPAGPNGLYGPARSSKQSPGEFPMGDAAFYALLGRIGESEPFQIGSSKKFAASATGELRLMANVRLPYLAYATGGHRVAVKITRKN